VSDEQEPFDFDAPEKLTPGTLAHTFATQEREGKTRSTGDAMKLLERRRAEKISRARELAADIARRCGSVHSRAVRIAMAADGQLSDNEPEFWLGAVFRTSEFEWTGEYFTYSDGARNIHERMVKVWRLK